MSALLASRWTALGCVLAALALASWGHARRSASAARPFEPPELRIDIDDLGGELARVDGAAMRLAFERAGLPDPPKLDGVDAFVVRKALAAADRWARLRDGDALGELATVWLALDQHAEASECFAAAVELGAQRERWLYLLGAVCQRLQWNDAALDALQRARALDGRVAITHARLGELALSSGRAREAVESFEAALRLDNQLSVAAAGKARAHLELNELPAALAAAQAAVRAQPRDFAAHRVLADVLARTGQLEQSASEAQLAKSLPTYQGWGTFDARWREAIERSGVLNFAAVEINSALAAGDLAFAQRRIETLIKRRPRDPGPLALLATLQAQSKQLDKARATIERAIALRPNDARHHVSAGEIALSADDAPRALAAAEQALKCSPESSEALALRGRALFVSQRVDEGLSDLRAALHATPEDLRMREILLEMLELAGRAADARALLDESTQVPTARAWAQTQIARRHAAGGGRR
mgnify:CR=1 FL=1